jgi:hypothetical protein
VHVQQTPRGAIEQLRFSFVPDVFSARAGLRALEKHLIGAHRDFIVGRNISAGSLVLRHGSSPK